MFGAQRRLWTPFLIGAILELCFIGLIWLAPHPPFSKVLAPPIRYFSSDNVLHYPTHLWFMYHSMKHAHLVVSILLGAFLTGIASEMVRQFRAGKAEDVSIRSAVLSRQVRYSRVVILWLITWGSAEGLLKLLTFIGAKVSWVLIPSIAVLIAWQALLVYAIPIAVFTQVSWWRALGRSFKEGLRYPFSTLMVVGVPSLVVIAFAIVASPGHVAVWMTQTEPEIALAVILVRILVLTVADAVMTVVISHLWWIHRAAATVASSAGSTAVPTLTPKKVERGPAVA